MKMCLLKLFGDQASLSGVWDFSFIWFNCPKNKKGKLLVIVPSICQYVILTFWQNNLQYASNTKHLEQQGRSLSRYRRECTLKNKGASQCHGRTPLSKWFHKVLLTSEEPFSFTKGFLW